MSTEEPKDPQKMSVAEIRAEMATLLDRITGLMDDDTPEGQALRIELLERRSNLLAVLKGKSS